MQSKAFWFVPLLLLLSLCSCSRTSHTFFTMDTVADVTIYSGDASRIAEMIELCGRYDALFSYTNEYSDVYRINHADGWVAVSDETIDVINQALHYCALTDGAFDITLGGVAELYDFGSDVLPDRADVAAEMRGVGYERVRIDGYRVDAGGTRITLAGIAKGYVADRLAAYMREHDMTGIVNLGGNVICVGKRAYRIGIQRPFTNQVWRSVDVTGKAAVTAGVYQRYMTVDGTVYSHILEPSTGMPVDNRVWSATVICDSATAADAISTACIVRPDRVEAWAKKLNAEIILYKAEEEESWH